MSYVDVTVGKGLWWQLEVTAAAAAAAAAGWFFCGAGRGQKDRVSLEGLKVVSRVRYEHCKCCAMIQVHRERMYVLLLGAIQFSRSTRSSRSTQLRQLTNLSCFLLLLRPKDITRCAEFMHSVYALLVFTAHKQAASDHQTRAERRQHTSSSVITKLEQLPPAHLSPLAPLYL